MKEMGIPHDHEEQYGCRLHGRSDEEVDRAGKSAQPDTWQGSMNRDQYTRLEQIPNIGPSIAKDLRLIGISAPRDLAGQDPYAMYEELCRKTRKRHDPCVIDVFISAVRFMQGEPKRPWWAYTPERKSMLTGKACPTAKSG